MSFIFDIFNGCGAECGEAKGKLEESSRRIDDLHKQVEEAAKRSDQLREDMEKQLKAMTNAKDAHIADMREQLEKDACCQETGGSRCQVTSR